MIRLFVIEDHSLIVDGLKNRFRPSRDDIEIVGSAEKVSEAVKKISKKDFDIIVLDLWIPGTDPMDNVARLKKKFPGKPIVMLTYEDSSFWEHQMFEAGVKGYLIKNADKIKIKKTMEDVMAGETVLPDGYHENYVPVRKTDAVVHKYYLKPSEKEIMIMISKGITQKEIAEIKGLTTWAVEKIVRKIRKRFGVKSNVVVLQQLTLLKLI